MAWEENGPLNNGPNTFKDTRTRTFKIKALHQRLPTAQRKQKMDPTYSTNQCLHCNNIETSDHIFDYQFTRSRNSVIFTQIANQIDPNLPNRLPIIHTLLNQLDQHPDILKGLVPTSWTHLLEEEPTKKVNPNTISKIIEIINTAISLFRKTIWQYWCTLRKVWERT